VDYAEARQYLESVIRAGIKYDLVNIRRLLAALGHPERRFPVVCVAGTNGKGSVCAFLESILAEAGYRAGLNTSPHLVTPRERIRINRRPVSPGEFASALTEVRAASESGWATDDPGRPTFFETMTAAALVHFRRAGADVAILEAGLGGRLDGTNAAQPLLSVVTRISIDHPKTLGRSLGKIAFEKFGLARPGRPLLIGAQRPRVARLLVELARFRGALPVRMGSRWRETEGGLELTTPRQRYARIRLGLGGLAQRENAACAVRAGELLAARGFHIGKGAVVAGLAAAWWPGRLELRHGERRVLMDCAHNPEGVRRLVAELDRIPARRRILIYASMGDKDIRAAARRLFPAASKILLPPLPQRRAAKPAEILELTGGLHPDVTTAASVADAWETALASSASEDLIVVTGSLYLVGEFKRATGEDSP